MKHLIIAMALLGTAAWAQHGAAPEAGHAPEGAAHGASHGSAEHHAPDMTPWKIANFVLLAAGLGYLLVKKGGPAFAERTREIRQGIDEAAKEKADADARAA